MKIAVVYNRDSKSVINLFGLPNREKIGMKTIQRLVTALKSGGHEVIALEGDKDLLDHLEEFMPRVVHGERPGMVFNVSYGIQGQARYTHVPSILEMAGIPYVASGPLGHSLSLDKVITKMILKQHGLPTPEFALLESPDAPVSEMVYPAIVKPKNEAVSFGLKIVNDEAELRAAAKVIYDEFHQAVLAERFIEGREVNVGLLGNGPPEALPPVELGFGSEGPRIYTYEDKTGRSGRKIEPICPAPIGEELTRTAKDLAIRAFQALGLYDCARVDMRLDDQGQFYILETNSLPSLGEHGSYLVGAAHAGLDFTAFVNRLVEVASARYFGTPEPASIDRKSGDARSQVQGYITQRRDRMERRVQEWVAVHSRTLDSLGCEQAFAQVGSALDGLGLRAVEDLTDAPEVATWETHAGLTGGTLLIANLDVPLELAAPHHAFRRTPEGLYGEGVGTSRAPLVVLEFVLRALRNTRKLKRLPLGVLLYGDEGREARGSAAMIARAAARAGEVLVLRPGAPAEKVYTRRRGNRVLRLRVEGPSLSPASPRSKTPLPWTLEKLERFSALGSAKRRVALSVLDLDAQRHPMRLPHRLSATLLLTYEDVASADRLEGEMRALLGKGGPRWELLTESDRPPMQERKINARLFEGLSALAAEHEIPLARDSSTWPSVAGLVPATVPCLCGLGPVALERGTPDEHVPRISLIRRALLLADYLASKLSQRGKPATDSAAGR